MPNPRKIDVVERPKAYPMMVKLKGRLQCSTAFDEERLGEYPDDQEFDLVPRINRSTKQYKLYRQLLSNFAVGSELWPTGDHLAAELKMRLGYWRWKYDTKTGKLVKAFDSTGYQAMSAPEFNRYFNLVLVKLTEMFGVDPMETLTDEQKN